MNEGVIDGFLLAEVLAEAARDGLAPALRSRIDERTPEDRVVFARRVARRLRPQARPDASVPPRIASLLGASGLTPRRRYRPPAGLLEALHRRLAGAPPIAEERARGGGRSVAAHLEDIRATFGPEDAAAALALAAHLEPPDEAEANRTRRIWAALEALDQATVANLGRAVLAEGDDALGRGGRELRELEEGGWLG